MGYYSYRIFAVLYVRTYSVVAKRTYVQLERTVRTYQSLTAHTHLAVEFVAAGSWEALDGTVLDCDFFELSKK